MCSKLHQKFQCFFDKAFRRFSTVSTGTFQTDKDVTDFVLSIATENPLIFEKIQEYTIVDVIGGGSSGIVLELDDDDDDDDASEKKSTVALKIFIESPLLVENEINMQECASKIGLAPMVYFAGAGNRISDGLAYGIIGMEKITGRVCSTMLYKRCCIPGQRHESPVEHVLRRVVSISRELFMRCGIIHGDIHLGNIIVDQNDNFIPIDFGRACVSHSEDMWKDVTYFNILHSMMLSKMYWTERAEAVLLEILQRRVPRVSPAIVHTNPKKAYSCVFHEADGEFVRAWKIYNVYRNFILVRPRSVSPITDNPEKIESMSFYHPGNAVANMIGAVYSNHLLIKTANGKFYILFESNDESRREMDQKFHRNQVFIIRDRYGTKEFSMYSIPTTINNNNVNK